MPRTKKSAEPSAQKEEVKIVRCNECHFFREDYTQEIEGTEIVVAHNICTRWGKGCQTAKDGFCYLGIRKVEKNGKQQKDRAD